MIIRSGRRRWLAVGGLALLGLVWLVAAVPAAFAQTPRPGGNGSLAPAGTTGPPSGGSLGAALRILVIAPAGPAQENAQALVARISETLIGAEATVAQGAARAEQAQPDVILLDDTTADEAGAASVRRLRPLADRVVYLAADGGGTKAAIQAAGGAYLVKPVSAQALSAALRPASPTPTNTATPPRSGAGTPSSALGPGHGNGVMATDSTPVVPAAAPRQQTSPSPSASATASATTSATASATGSATATATGSAGTTSPTATGTSAAAPGIIIIDVIAPGQGVVTTTPTRTGTVTPTPTQPGTLPNGGEAPVPLGQFASLGAFSLAVGLGLRRLAR